MEQYGKEAPMAFTQGYALLVGIGAYQQHPVLNVPTTVHDAAAIAAVLRDPHACGYPKEQVTVLNDTTATRDGVLKALDRLAGLSEDATVFLFYSGHGATGADGNYCLTTYDTKIEAGRVVAGTGIGEQELLTRLRAINAKRLLLIVNACHGGAVSPVLEAGEQALAGTQLPEKTATALLATGTGRVIVTACHEDQVSFVGGGDLTLFGQALVDGLQGKGDYIANRHGFISAFDLYSHLYDTLQTWVPQQIDADVRKKYGDTQEPELTILKGVGPFAVALYRGASTLGDFSAPDRPEIDSGLREVDEARSKRLLGQILASGPFAGATITTQQSGGVNLGIGTQIGQVGDIIAGDKIGGDKVAGDKITVGDITGSSGIALSRGARATVTTGLSGSETARLFQAIYAQIQARPADPSVETDEIQGKVQQIEQEAQAGMQANAGKLGRWLRELAGMAPDIFDVTVACLTNPVAGVAEAAKKVAAKAKADSAGS
jgi:hypothetical protein